MKLRSSCAASWMADVDWERAALRCVKPPKMADRTSSGSHQPDDEGEGAMVTPSGAACDSSAARRAARWHVCGEGGGG